MLPLLEIGEQLTEFFYGPKITGHCKCKTKTHGL